MGKNKGKSRVMEWEKTEHSNSMERWLPVLEGILQHAMVRSVWEENSVSDFYFRNLWYILLCMLNFKSPFYTDIHLTISIVSQESNFHADFFVAEEKYNIKNISTHS